MGDKREVGEQVRVKIWLERNGIPVVGEGRAALLRLIDERGSLKRAAAELGMSYRHAWGLVRKIEGALGIKVVSTRRGGASGGETRLTPDGRALLQEYDRAVGNFGL